jgi:autotransporter-associated beta strand protein
VSAAITQTNDHGGTTVGLTKSGAGTLVLAAANSYSGPTTVSAGVLSIQRASLADASAISIATGARMALDFIGNDVVANVTLGGVAYTAPGHYDANTYPAYFTGTGSLVIPGSLLDYNTWKSANGVTGGELDDDDHDGLGNREEYAFGLLPNNGSSCNPISVPLNRETGKFSYTRRVTSKSDLVYSVWFSGDLGTWTMDSGASDGTPVQAGDVESVEVTLSPLAGVPLPARLFVQVRAQ